MSFSERISPAQQPLGFDYDEGHGEQGLTALAGIPVLLQAFRSLDLPRSVARHVSIKQRQRGLDVASYVESFVILNAAGDSACYDKQRMNWLRNEQREDGPGGPIRFAISARMQASLKEHILRLPCAAWKPYREDREAVSECADVLNYWPEAEDDRQFGPLRFVAIRIRKRQGELFSEGAEARHFAVVSNVWDWEAQRLLEWHREKAGTIEAIHDVLKNELAAGVVPCSRFRANAAWLRLAVLTHNVITALNRMALPESYLTARPKRLRFLIFNTAVRILHRARRVLCRIAGVGWRDWMRLMPRPTG